MYCLHVCLCEGVWSPGTGITGSCELPHGCWKLNWGPLEEQPVTLTTEPSLQLWFSLTKATLFQNRCPGRKTLLSEWVNMLLLILCFPHNQKKVWHWTNKTFIALPCVVLEKLSMTVESKQTWPWIPQAYSLSPREDVHEFTTIVTGHRISESQEQGHEDCPSCLTVMCWLVYANLTHARVIRRRGNLNLTNASTLSLKLRKFLHKIRL